MSHMLTRELIDTAAAGQVFFNRRMLGYALQENHVKRPDKNSLGQWVFTQENFNEIVAWFGAKQKPVAETSTPCL